MTHDDFTTALSRIGTFVDISEDDFLQLRNLMVEAAAKRRLQPSEIKLGHYYSNGATGAEWSVRRIVDEQAGKLDGNVIDTCNGGGSIEALVGLLLPVSYRFPVGY